MCTIWYLVIYCGSKHFFYKFTWRLHVSKFDCTKKNKFIHHITYSQRGLKCQENKNVTWQKSWQKIGQNWSGQFGVIPHDFKVYSIKIVLREVAHSHYMSPKFLKSLKTIYWPCFSIGVFKLNTFLSVKFSKFFKAHQSYGRAPRWLICIFTNNLSNIKTNTHYFFVIVRLFLRNKTSGCAHASWTWHKRIQAKSKQIRNEAVTIKFLKWHGSDQ